MNDMTYNYPSDCTEKKPLRVKVSNKDFRQKIGWDNRILTVAAEVSKLVAAFHAVAEYSQSNTYSCLLWATWYVGAGIYQKSVITRAKNSLNKAEFKEGNFWYYKNENPIAGKESHVEQLTKSMMPGRGLSFVKIPKLTRA